jgi:anti-sigma factor RsiW
MDCKRVRAHLDAYVDGELEPTPVIELEQHLDGCADCRNELALVRLAQQGLRALPTPPVSLELRSKIVGALDAAEGGSSVQRPLRASLAGGLAAAAAVVLGLGALFGQGRPQQAPAASLAADSNPLGVLGDVVAHHTDQLPADIAADRPEQVTSWCRGKVGFRVRSVEFAEPKVRFLGARVSQVRDQRAVKLSYSVGDSRLTSMVFQSPPSLSQMLRDDHVSQRWGAHRERIGSRVVTYHNVQGYTVPILEHDGITYAFTGDLDQRKLLQLVASARMP